MTEIVIGIVGTTVGMISVALAIVQLRVVRGRDAPREQPFSIAIESRRRRPDTLRRKYPNGTFIDVTANGMMPWARLCPSFPHGDIPIPFSPGCVSASITSMWEGLEVFENRSVDTSIISRASTKNIKRNKSKLGRFLGYGRGVNTEEVLDVVPARALIYVPAYRWVLENHAAAEIDKLREIA